MLEGPSAEASRGLAARASELIALTPEALYLAVVLALALVLFYTAWIRLDLTALLVVLALVLPWKLGEDGRLHGILTPAQGFNGFGSTAVIMLAGMFVLSAAMVRTGAAPLLGEKILRAGSGSLWLLQLTVFVSVTLFSSVVSNTTTVLIGLPLVLAICKERGYPAQKLLMPLAFASLLGGQWTLIGTRSNILLSEELHRRMGEGLGFFEFTPVAAVILLVSLVFFFTIGRYLLPSGEGAESLAERYDVTEYLTEVMAGAGSDMVGKTIAQLELQEKNDVTLVQIIRGNEYRPPTPWLKIQEGDVFVVQGQISKITSLLEKGGLQFKEELQLGDKTLRSVDLVMIEAVVAPRSELEGRRLEDIDFQERYGLSVLAIGRRGHRLEGRPQAQELKFGDALLLVAHQQEIEHLRGDPNLVLVESRSMPFIGRTKALWVTGLVAMIAVTSAAGWLQPAFVIPLAAVLAIATGCVNMREAYEAIDWRTLVVVAGMIPFGAALEVTGTDETLAQAVIETFRGAGPQVLLAGVMALVLLMTQLIGNAAVAVIFAPVCYNLALAAGADPKAFLLGAAMCASASFMTPVAHESTILVMGPGGYSFKDYTKLGTPLAVITWIVTVFVLPLIYPLTP
jgi:di/tricarboxylate transporter